LEFAFFGALTSVGALFILEDKKMKKILSLFCVIALSISLLPLLASCALSQNQFNKKMDELVSLLNFDGLSKEEYFEILTNDRSASSQDYRKSVETLIEELKLNSNKPGNNWDRHQGYPYLNELYVYVENCDIDRLLYAAKNGDGLGFSTDSSLYPKSSEYIYTAVYDVFPERFIKPVLQDNIGTGYYIDHPDANPGVTRESPYSKNPNLMNTYVVKHYGDFAIEESETWHYDEGKYEWIDGVFYDEPGFDFQRQETDLYYKGEYIISIKGSFKNSNHDMNNILIYESNKYICAFYITDGLLDSVNWDFED